MIICVFYWLLFSSPFYFCGQTYFLIYTFTSKAIYPQYLHGRAGITAAHRISGVTPPNNAALADVTAIAWSYYLHQTDCTIRGFCHFIFYPPHNEHLYSLVVRIKIFYTTCGVQKGAQSFKVIKIDNFIMALGFVIIATQAYF